MEEMIQKGIALGLTHMCFTEHNDFDFPVSEDTPQGMFELNPDAYLYDLIRLREKYAGQIRILFGVELGLQPHLIRQNAIFAKSHDYDFIIGSSHVCGGQDPYYPAFYEGRSQEEAYREYFQSVIENLKKFDNFDVYGHLDYVVRYGPEKDRGYCYETYSDLFDRILELLLEKGRGLNSTPGESRTGCGMCTHAGKCSAAIGKKEARSSPSVPMPMIPPRLPPISTEPRRCCRNAASGTILSLKIVSRSLNAFRA